LLKKRGVRPQRKFSSPQVQIFGPCSFALTSPTLNPRKQLMVCPGVIPPLREQVIDGDLIPDNLETALEAGARSPLFNWISLRGPVAVMEWMSKKYGLKKPPVDEFGGNCEAHYFLYTDPEYARRLPDALKEKAEEIANELAVLEALGYLKDVESGSIFGLWSDVTSATVEDVL
jgi:hypothetical protein